MLERKLLKIDLSPLWDNPKGIFILRFNDINQTQQTLLALRIKKCARQHRIRRDLGPTVNTIHKALQEINPIIFGESFAERRRTHQNFNVFYTRQISGWYFKELCQAIYLTTCIKKQPKERQLIYIARLSSMDYDRTRIFVENWYLINNQQETTEERITQTRNIGMNEIAEARINANMSNENRVLRDLGINPNIFQPIEPIDRFQEYDENAQIDFDDEGPIEEHEETFERTIFTPEYLNRQDNREEIGQRPRTQTFEERNGTIRITPPLADFAYEVNVRPENNAEHFIPRVRINGERIINAEN